MANNKLAFNASQKNEFQSDDDGNTVELVNTMNFKEDNTYFR